MPATCPFEILTAHYGQGDVTDKVRKKLKEDFDAGHVAGSFTIKATNEWLGDPNPGFRKTLLLVWRVRLTTFRQYPFTDFNCTLVTENAEVTIQYDHLNTPCPPMSPGLRIIKALAVLQDVTGKVNENIAALPSGWTSTTVDAPQIDPTAATKPSDAARALVVVGAWVSREGRVIVKGFAGPWDQPITIPGNPATRRPIYQWPGARLDIVAATCHSRDITQDLRACYRQASIANPTDLRRWQFLPSRLPMCNVPADTVITVVWRVRLATSSDTDPVMSSCQVTRGLTSRLMTLDFSADDFETFQEPSFRDPRTSDVFVPDVMVWDAGCNEITFTREAQASLASNDQSSLSFESPVSTADSVITFAHKDLSQTQSVPYITDPSIFETRLVPAGAKLTVSAVPIRPPLLIRAAFFGECDVTSQVQSLVNADQTLTINMASWATDHPDWPRPDPAYEAVMVVLYQWAGRITEITIARKDGKIICDPTVPVEDKRVWWTVHMTVEMLGPKIWAIIWGDQAAPMAVIGDGDFQNVNTTGEFEASVAFMKNDPMPGSRKLALIFYGYESGILAAAAAKEGVKNSDRRLPIWLELNKILYDVIRRFQLCVADSRNSPLIPGKFTTYHMGNVIAELNKIIPLHAPLALADTKWTTKQTFIRGLCSSAVASLDESDRKLVESDVTVDRVARVLTICDKVLKWLPAAPIALDLLLAGLVELHTTEAEFKEIIASLLAETEYTSDSFGARVIDPLFKFDPLTAAVLYLFTKFETGAQGIPDHIMPALRSKLCLSNLVSIVLSNPKFPVATKSIVVALNRSRYVPIDEIEQKEWRLGEELLKKIARTLALCLPFTTLPTLAIGFLFAGLDSAYLIASRTKAEVVSALQQYVSGMDTQVGQVYDHALAIKARNQSLIKTARFDKDRDLACLEPTWSKSLRDVQLIDFVDEVGYFIADYGAPNLSPAAYFFELLNFLPTDVSTRLLQRRPDLVDIELSVENTEVEIPYIDLANEVMESYIQADAKTVRAYNTALGTENGELQPEPLNVDFSVYEKLQASVFPLTTLPFDLGLERQRLLLGSLRLSRHDFLVMFRDPTRFSMVPAVEKTLWTAQLAKLKQLQPAVVDRAANAEYLGLSAAHHLIITKQTYWTREAYDICFGTDSKLSDQEYAKILNVPGVASLWGYERDADMLSTNTSLPAAQRGLSFVVDAFLPRSGLTLEEAVNLAHTHIVGDSIVPDVASGVLPLTIGNWTVDVLYLIQAFLRLRRCAALTIEELDQALFVFHGVDNVTSSIKPEFLGHLAALKQICALSELSMLQALAFYSPLSITGEMSLYKDLLLRRNIVRVDGVFLQLAHRIDHPPLKDHLIVLLGALGCKAETFTVLAKSKNPAFVSPDRWTSLTADNITIIYRALCLARTAAIPQEQIDEFVTIFKTVFDDPNSTLYCLKLWRSLSARGITLAQLSALVTDDADASNVRPELSLPSLKLATALRTAVNQAKLDNVIDQKQAMNSEQLRTLSSRILTQDQIKDVFEVLEGEMMTTSLISSSVDVGDDATVDTINIGGRVWLYKATASAESARLVLKGLLTESEVQATVQAFDKLGLQAVGKLIPALSEKAARAAASTLRILPISTQAEKLSAAILTNGDREGKGGFSAAANLKLFQAFITNLFLKQSESHAIVSVFQTVLTMMDPEILATALKMMNGLDARSFLASDDLFGESTNAPKPWIGYITTPTSGSHVFSSPEQPATALVLNGVPYEWSESGTSWVTGTISLSTKQLYEVTLPRRDIRWTSSQMALCEISASSKVSKDEFNRVRNFLVVLKRVELIVGAFRLSLDDFDFFQSHTEQLFDLLKPLKIDDLRKLDVIASYPPPHSDDAQDEIAQSPVLQVFKWALTKPQPAPTKRRSDPLPAILDWDAEMTATVLQMVTSSSDSSDASDALQKFSNVERLFQLMTAVSGTGIHSENITDLFSMAEPSKGVGVNAVADDLQRLLRSRVKSDEWEKTILPINNRLREKRSEALIAYLLRQSSIRDAGVKDAGGLFEHFLIDVQMSPSLLTARIKQATSTIQLFVQRVFLGLESGINTQSIKTLRTKWQIMGSFRVWEASRKIWAFPENWLNAELLDIKSSTFDSTVSQLRQGTIDIVAAQQAVASYVYGLNEIETLQVVAKLLRTQEQDIHMFAQTKHAPVTFFHRVHTETDGWTPWTQLKSEIPIYESDRSFGTFKDSPDDRVRGAYLVPVAWNSRLFVLIPTFKKADMPGVGSDTGSQKTWDIHLEWIEYRGGQWTAKKGLNGSVVDHQRASAYYNGSKNAPDVSEYKFVPIVGSLQPTAAFMTEFKTKGYSEVMIRWAVNEANGDTNTARYLLGHYGEKSTIGDLYKDDSRRVTLQVYKTFHYKQGKDAPEATADGRYQDSLIGHFEIHFDDLVCAGFSRTGTALLLGNYYSPAMLPRFHLLGNGSDFEASAVKMPSDNGGRISRSLMNSHFTTLQFGTTDLNTLPSMAGEFSDTVPRSSLGALSGTTDGKFGPLQYQISGYAWEIGLYVPMLLVDIFLSSQQYDAALAALRCVYDPRQGASSQRWVWRPFREQLQAMQTTSESPFVEGTSSDHLDLNPHAIARKRPTAFLKWVLMKQIEVLIAYGDYYFRQNTLETLPEALQCYVEADHIYGPRLKTYTRKSTRVAPTFSNIKTIEQDFAADIESFFPGLPSTQVPAGTDANQGSVAYQFFVPPKNDKLTEIRDTIDDRLFKIRNSMDINGNVRTLSLYEPAIDPGLLVRAAAAGSLSLSSVLAGLNQPLSHVRFSRLIQSALDVCYDLRLFWASVLAAKQCKDVEALARLQVQQSSASLKLDISLKELAVEQAKTTKEALTEARNGCKGRIQHFLRTTSGNKSDVPVGSDDFKEKDYTGSVSQMNEYGQFPKDIISFTSFGLGSGALGVAFIAHGIVSQTPSGPETTAAAHPQGIGTDVKEKLPGRENGEALVKALEIVAEQGAKIGEIFKYAAECDSRLAEHKLELNEAGVALNNLNRQIDVQKVAIELAERDLENARAAVERTGQVEEFLKSKYSSTELYAWLENALQIVYYQTYTLAYDLARKAERAYRFERGITARTPDIIDLGYWDTGRGGAIAGERLYVGLRQLKQAYDETRAHDFEVTKRVSLAALDPSALDLLRANGSCHFWLPEWSFDLDFPGHFRRRIRSVALAVRGQDRTAREFAATLVLLRHKYRAVDGATDYAESAAGLDPRFASDNVPISSIVVSDAEPSSGVFELNFAGDGLLPFEGAGAISEWSVELSAACEEFKGEIEDVLLVMQYTSSRGQVAMKAEALKVAKKLKKAAEDARNGVS